MHKDAFLVPERLWRRSQSGIPVSSRPRRSGEHFQPSTFWAYCWKVAAGSCKVGSLAAKQQRQVQWCSITLSPAPKSLVCIRRWRARVASAEWKFQAQASSYFPPLLTFHWQLDWKMQFSTHLQIFHFFLSQTPVKSSLYAKLKPQWNWRNNLFMLLFAAPEKHSANKQIKSSRLVSAFELLHQSFKPA